MNSHITDALASQKNITVADILGMTNARSHVYMTHIEEDDIRGIFTELTEKSTAELFIAAYGLHKMSDWRITAIYSENDKDTSVIHIVYDSRK